MKVVICNVPQQKFTNSKLFSNACTLQMFIIFMFIEYVNKFYSVFLLF